MCQPTLLSALVKEAAVTGEDFDAAEEALRNFNRRIEATRGFAPDQWLPSELIDCAIKSARERAIDDVIFVEADAAEYRFPRPQDLIVSRCGVMFFGDLVAAFSNLRSGLSRAGRILLVVWRAPEQNEWYQFPMRCAAAFSDQQPEHDPDAPGAFTLADPAKLKHILCLWVCLQRGVDPSEKEHIECL